MVRSASAAVARPLQRPLMGVLFMVLGGCLMPLMNGVAKLMGQDYPPEQVVWARTVGHLAFVLALFAPQAGWQVVLTRRPGVQIPRSCLLMGSTFLLFWAIRFVPIAQAASIVFTAPLIVAVLAGPMLGERLTPARVAAVIVGFAGVLVVIRPGTAMFQWPSLLIVGSAICYAFYQLLTRRAAAFDPPETSSVYSALVGSVMMSLIVPFSWKAVVSATDALLFCSLGALGGMAHYCMARAMTYAAASFLSPFIYWQMVGSVAVGYLMFAEIPDVYTWAGAALIIAAGVHLGLEGQARANRAGAG